MLEHPPWIRPWYASVKERQQALQLSRTYVLAIVFVIYVKFQDIILLYIIIESVDSISRDGPDTPIYIIHYKKRNNSEQENF